MKRTITFLLFLLSVITVWGQNTIVMSPEVATLGKYGNYPVSHYTGSPDIHIPLYTLRTRQIEIPVYLQYDASGFMPGKESGKVGHDWTLFAGGAITRTVNGVPDEFRCDGDIYNMYGHWYGLNRNVDFYNDSILYLEQTDQIGSYETTPDLFSFNFLGHCGRFMIDHEGNVQVAGEGNYKVDLDGFMEQEVGACTEISTIVITDGYGTRYTFGGTSNALEVSLLPIINNTTGGSMPATIANGVITSFYLTKIETQSGEVVHFNYLPDGFNAFSGYSDHQSILKNCYYADACGSFYGEYNTENATNGIAVNTTDALTKSVYLESIVAPSGTVRFHYKEREQEFMRGPTHWNDSIPLRLNDIKVLTPTGDHVKGIRFFQSFVEAKDMTPARGIKCQRMFLDSLYIGQDKYTLEYNERTNLPRPETRGIDLRGFYNGNDNNGSLLPLNYNGLDDVDFNHRQPSCTHASKAMLKKITYPTGGSTEFTYENHTYGLAIRKHYGNWHPLNYFQNGMVGGLRIQKIEHSNGEVKEYEYTTVHPDDGETVISSGVFNDIKTYAFYDSFENIGYGITNLYLAEANGIVHCSSYAESEIVYSKVTERIGNNEGYTVYEYTTYEDAPDLPVLGTGTCTFTNEENLTDKTRYQLYCMLSYTSQWPERGKLKLQSEYKEDGTLLRETWYTYNTDTARTQQAIYSAGTRLSISGTYGITNSVAYYHYPNWLTRKEIREYVSPVNYIITTTEYAYNGSNKQVSSVRTYNSDGVEHRTEYKYPVDNAVYNDMKESFVVFPVIEEKKYVNNKLTKTLTHHYQKYHDKFFAPAYTNLTMGNGTPHRQRTVHDYDERGNLLSQTEAGKPTENYIWGYNYQYPVAYLSNASLNEIAGVLNNSRRTAIATAPTLSDSDWSTLVSLAASLPEANVTCYRYSPLTGMTRMREANELDTYYSYDLFGRLTAKALESPTGRVMTAAYHTVNIASPMHANWSDSASSFNQGTRNFGVEITGGSKVNGYAWTLKNNTGNILGTGTGESFSYTFTSQGNYTLTCLVTDMVTQETKTLTRSFSISGYTIEFTNVSTTADYDQGSASTTATIVCQTATTLNFRIDYMVPPTISSTYYECIVGSYSTTGSGRDSKEFTVTLPAGTHRVELNVYSVISEANVDLTITGTATSGTVVGSNNYLNVYF